jgi:hypothetical protein
MTNPNLSLHRTLKWPPLLREGFVKLLGSEANRILDITGTTIVKIFILKRRSTKCHGSAICYCLNSCRHRSLGQAFLYVPSPPFLVAKINAKESRNFVWAGALLAFRFRVDLDRDRAPWASRAATWINRFQMLLSIVIDISFWMKMLLGVGSLWIEKQSSHQT